MYLSDELTLKKNALTIRRGIMRAIRSNHGGHIGGSLDLADMLSVIFTDFVRVQKDDPKWGDRDYVIFSKGHAGPALYSSLAFAGVLDYERLDHLNNTDSLLPGHCDRLKVPGVDATTGSLGQGLSIACGVALAAKLRKTDQRIFGVIGDGEAAEGQIWEAAQMAAHYKLDNLICFLDYNGMQIDGSVEQVMDLRNPVDKFKSFGWNAVLVDGADVKSIQFQVNSAIENKTGAPTMIVLKTIKGKGAKCIEQMSNNHCIGVSDELYENIMSELQEQECNLEVRKV